MHVAVRWFPRGLEQEMHDARKYVVEQEVYLDVIARDEGSRYGDDQANEYAGYGNHLSIAFRMALNHPNQ